jgi:hypothetical protein
MDVIGSGSQDQQKPSGEAPDQDTCNGCSRSMIWREEAQGPGSLKRPCGTCLPPTFSRQALVLGRRWGYAGVGAFLLGTSPRGLIEGLCVVLYDRA